MKQKAVKKNQSVEKVLRIIEVMSTRRGPMRLQDIAAASELPSSTAIRFLNTLSQYNYVVQDPDSSRYALTLKICKIANEVHAQISVRDVIRPHILKLSDMCGESACTAIAEGAQVVYIDVVEGPDQMLRTLQRIGKRAPLHSTGVGKCLLLNYSDAELATLAEATGLESLTEHTVTEIEGLKAEIDRVRADGYALDDEECELGVRCVAAPVRDFSGDVVAAISISGPASRMTGERIERVKDRVRSTAAAISTQLGYTPETRPVPATEKPV